MTNPTVPDGPDTELAAAIGYFRGGDLRADYLARGGEYVGRVMGEAAATIVRAVLARPAAGRDLTASDVVAATADLFTLTREPANVAARLNAVARPAVARTDGQCTCGDPSAADLVHHTEAPCRTVEELRTGRTDGQPHPDPHGRYDVPDAYDHPGWPLVSRIVAIATDTAPTMPNETDGVDNAVTGLLADQSWRDHVAMADVMGLVGDWGTDDVVQAVTDALHEYPRLRALVARTDGQSPAADAPPWTSDAAATPDGDTSGMHQALDDLRAECGDEGEIVAEERNERAYLWWTPTRVYGAKPKRREIRSLPRHPSAAPADDTAAPAGWPDDIGAVLRDLRDDLTAFRVQCRDDGEVLRAVGVGDALDMLAGRIARHPRRSGQPVRGSQTEAES